jgi:ABC-type uncharacterized transport system substrate-binding protein
MTLALRYGDGAPERMHPLASEMVALNPDVIVAGGQSGALAAHSATSTIPIVAITIEDPVVSGLAKSIARPGGNMTGTWVLGDDALVGKGLDFLKLVVPGLVRVAALFNADDPNDRVQRKRLLAAAPALGVTIQIFEVRNLSKLEELADEITRANVHGLVIGMSPFFLSSPSQITANASRQLRGYLHPHKMSQLGAAV